MNCPSVKSDEVKVALCELWYPYGCGVKCKRLYERWLKEEAEVRELEGVESNE